MSILCIKYIESHIDKEVHVLLLCDNRVSTPA